MIWDAIMYNGEEDMLACRMEAFLDAPVDVRHVVVEGRHTHRGVPKPLTFPARELAGDPEFRYVIDSAEPDPDPWANEHRQRNAAWKVIDAEAADDDTVLIADLDEIPSPELLEAASLYGEKGPAWPVKVFMRTFLFACDWEVDWAATAGPEPATCVLAPVRFLREQAAQGRYLAEVRAAREQWLPLARKDGLYWGWHFSWVGSPQRQAAKLETGTCHMEILGTPEAELIRSGARWRSQEAGGGLPVIPVNDLSGHPAYVRERRCPQSWFRPRAEEET